MPSIASPGSVRRVYLLAVAGTLVWLAAVFLAPWLAAKGADASARFVYSVFSPVCHQIPERCFAFRGHALAVCGRCLGIYVGFMAGLVIYPFVRGLSRLALPPARVFFLMVFPMALDACAGLLGLWKSPIEVRFITGFIWGTILPFYFVAGASGVLSARKSRADARALARTARKKVE